VLLALAGERLFAGRGVVLGAGGWILLLCWALSSAVAFAAAVTFLAEKKLRAAAAGTVVFAAVTGLGGAVLAGLLRLLR